MQNKYLVLLGDEETGEWSVAVNSADKQDAHSEYIDLKRDGTPAIFIATEDFVTV